MEVLGVKGGGGIESREEIRARRKEGRSNSAVNVRGKCTL